MRQANETITYHDRKIIRAGLAFVTGAPLHERRVIQRSDSAHLHSRSSATRVQHEAIHRAAREAASKAPADGRLVDGRLVHGGAKGWLSCPGDAAVELHLLGHILPCSSADATTMPSTGGVDARAAFALDGGRSWARHARGDAERHADAAGPLPQNTKSLEECT